MSPRWSNEVGLAVAAQALLGGIGGLFPAVVLHLVGLSTPLALVYLVVSFATSACVVYFAYRAGSDRTPAPYALTMIGLGTLNGGFSAVLQGGLGVEDDFVLLMGMFGACVGLVLSIVYTLAFWPGMRLVRDLMLRPTRHDGVWLRQVVGLTWMGAGALLVGGNFVLSEVPFPEESLPAWAPLGVLLVGASLVAVSFVQRQRLGRVASGAHPGFERVAASALDGVGELPRLHPGVSPGAAFVVLRLESQDDGPYRAGVTGEPYARVD